MCPWGFLPCGGGCAPFGTTCCGNGFCNPGQTCCGGLCCNPGTYCSKYGCTPIGAIDCGSHYCNPGQVCSSAGGCMPQGAVDCGNGRHCNQGFQCASGDRCIPEGNIDCGGYSCKPGLKCASGGCIPEDAIDCGNSRSCPSGFICAANDKCISKLAIQREEEERASRLTAEEQRLAAARALSAALDGCRLYVISSCEAALNSSLITGEEKTNVHSWLTVARKFENDKASCRSGTVSACNEALASPAADANSRRELEKWRNAASPYYRTIAYAVALWGQTQEEAALLLRDARNLPASTQFLAAVVAIQTIGLLLFLVWRRKAAVSGAALHENTAAQQLRSASSPSLPEKEPPEISGDGHSEEGDGGVERAHGDPSGAVPARSSPSHPSRFDTVKSVSEPSETREGVAQRVIEAEEKEHGPRIEASAIPEAPLQKAPPPDQSGILTAAMVMGILGGCIGLVVASFGYMLFGVAGAMNGQHGTAVLLQLAVFACPVASLVGAAMVKSRPAVSGLLMLAGGAGLLLLFGLGFFTMLPVILCGLAGGMALRASAIIGQA